MIRQILRLSMRHFKLYDHTSFDHRDMFCDRSNANLAHLGECVYTLNTSNIKWPKGVSYTEMMDARYDVYAGMRK